MSAKITDSFFRVIDASGQWMGSGFLLRVEGIEAQPVLLTCAHVVADALGDRALSLAEAAPDGTFFVDFPNSAVTNPIKARVYQNDPNAWFPMASSFNDQKPLSDLALVNIDMIRPPDGVIPITLSDSSSEFIGKTVYALQGAVKGTDYRTNLPTLAEGIVQGQPGALLQIRAVNPADKAFVEGGCSGSPLWATEPESLVGVISLANADKNLAWVIPAAALREIYGGDVDSDMEPTESVEASALPEIPFDFQPRRREILLKRDRLESEVDEKIDEVFLLYLHGEPNTGKSSEVQRLMESPKAKLAKDRTIWTTCVTDLEFSEMADEIAEKCLGIEQGKRFGARDLIRALKEKEMYLVLAGYSKVAHPTIAPLVELAADREKPTHIVVTTYDDPDSSNLEQCAVRIPKVDREDLISSIEALGTELTIEYAQLVDVEQYDAIAAHSIVNQIRKGEQLEVPEADPVSRVAVLRQNHWTPSEFEVLSCLALIETSVSDDLYESLCKRLGLLDWVKFRTALQNESLIRTDAPKTFTLRDYCRLEIRDSLSDEAAKACHATLADIFFAMTREKKFKGFEAATVDIISAFRAIYHFQKGTVETKRRIGLLSKIKESAARKGLHRQLSNAIGHELASSSEFDPWLLIQLIQSQVALGRIEDAFDTAKAAQKKILSSEKVDRNLVVSLCTQFASVLSQARENTLAGHLLGVSKTLFPDAAISHGLVPIRASLKAWCDGKVGKTANARRVGNRLLASAKQLEGRRRWMQVGIESTRLGVLEASLGNFEQADAFLREAVENFCKCDRRGEIWALSHLCFAKVSNSSTQIPLDDLERLLDLHATTLLISEETFTHFQAFELALSGHPLHAKLEALSKEFSPRYQDIGLSEYDVAYAEAFIESLQFRFSSRKSNPTATTTSSDVLNNVRTSKHSPVDIALGDNPQQALAKLYDEIPRDELLNSPFYSRVLTTALSKIGDSDLIDAFVQTHLSHLVSSRRSARLNYAGFFERCGRSDIALQLLETLRNEDSFRFHNVSANSYKNTDFDRALLHNERALSKANSPEEKSRIHNNMAALLLQHGKEESKSVILSNLCRAMELRADHFYWPYRTKLAADLTFGSIGEFPNVLGEYVQSQKLSQRAIKYVTSLLNDPEKRMRFLDLSPDYLTID